MVDELVDEEASLLALPLELEVVPEGLLFKEYEEEEVLADEEEPLSLLLTPWLSSRPELSGEEAWEPCTSLL